MKRELAERWFDEAKLTIRTFIPYEIKPRFVAVGKPSDEYASLAHVLALIDRVQLRLKGEAITEEELAEVRGFIRGILWVYNLDCVMTPS